MMILPVMIILGLHKGLLGESVCGEEKFRSATIGGQVTLSVEEPEFLFIYWVTSDVNIIAKTSPGEPVEIRQTEYEGRLKANAKGSLIIMNVTRGDQQQYTANVQRRPSDQCLQTFDLRVFGALSVESCAGQTIVSSVEGGEVTLPVNQTGFESITWVTVKDLVHFAATKPGKPVVIRDTRYTDRLNVTTNGSLIITGLTREDQGTYGSYAVTPTSQQCAQLYNLTVTVLESGFRRPDYRMVNAIRLGISGFVLLITCSVLIHHVKTEVMGPSTNK